MKHLLSGGLVFVRKQHGRRRPVRLGDDPDVNIALEDVGTQDAGAVMDGLVIELGVFGIDNAPVSACVLRQEKRGFLATFPQRFEGAGRGKESAEAELGVHASPLISWGLPARRIASAALKIRWADRSQIVSPWSQCWRYPRLYSVPERPRDSVQINATPSASTSRMLRGVCSSSVIFASAV